jgi:hypothetical protein
LASILLRVRKRPLPQLLVHSVLSVHRVKPLQQLARRRRPTLLRTRVLKFQLLPVVKCRRFLHLLFPRSLLPLLKVRVLRFLLLPVVKSRRFLRLLFPRSLPLLLRARVLRWFLLLPVVKSRRFLRLLFRKSLLRWLKSHLRL